MNLTKNFMKLNFVAWFVFLALGGATAFAQPAPIPFHEQQYSVNSGEHAGILAKSLIAFRETVQVPHAPWLQLHFSHSNLGKQSYVTITSLKDGGHQRLGTQDLINWKDSSAFFNGDAVEVHLHVAPGEEGIFFRISELTVGEWVGGGAIETLCGNDKRSASNDPRVSRIVPVGCTGWIVSNGAHLTAGHCAGAGMTTLEFNVPASQCDGTIVHPGPNDQYAIDANSVVSVNGGLGNDYTVFTCFRNGNTRLLPVEAQGAFYRMSKDDSPATVRVTGFGLDSTPAGCTNNLNADSQTQQTDSGAFLREVVQGASSVYIEYTVDTEPANSGSPVIVDGTLVTVGIHTNGGCSPPSTGNKGTGFENDNLESAIQTFPGTNVVYVDRGHTVTQKEGTVFRPYSKVSDAIPAVASGGGVSIVAGSYPASEGNAFTAGQDGKAMTLQAPVGTVIIGN
jgi:hypothetical protein